MAQDPNRPKDDGRIGLPRTDSSMNKIAPALDKKNGKGGDRKAKKRDAASKQALIARAKKNMDRAIRSESENRKAALEDLKFTAGDQWPADIRAQRVQDKRPCETVNKLPVFIHAVANDLRQNRPTIDIHPVGDRGDKEVAKFYRGMIRHIERKSQADVAYDTGVESAITMGWGYWRILTDYESEKGFNKCIHIQRIRNPFTVYMDPDSQEPDGADSRFAFITEMMPRDEFRKTYPDADQVQWDPRGVGELRVWADENNVRVAEYFEIRDKTRTLVQLSTGHVGYKDELDESTMSLIASGEIEIEEERDAKCPTVRWYKLTATEVLEEREWPGKWIPIVRVVGDEIDIEGKVRFSGIVREAKGPQRMYNYWSNSEIELVALAPKAPFIVAEGQIDGYEDMWRTANTKNYNYLIYRPQDSEGNPAGPPQRQQPQAIPAAVVQAKSGAQADMMGTTGVRMDATPQERLRDESGKALRELQRATDIGSFHYADNLARSLRHTGNILVDLIPKVYDRAQVVTILREDDKEEKVKINPNIAGYFEDRDQKTGKTTKHYNPGVGEYSVTVNTGPSFATKRIESAESMIQFMNFLSPEQKPMVADLIASQMDWPGSDQIASRLAKSLPPHVLTPDQKDVPPQVSALIQGLQQQLQKMNIEKQQMIKELLDKKADQALKKDKIDKDFEAKLMAIAAKLDGEAAHDMRKLFIEHGFMQDPEIAMEQALGRAVQILSQPRVTHLVRDQAGRPDHAIEEGVGDVNTGHPAVDVLVQRLGAPKVKQLRRGPDGRAAGAVKGDG